MSNKLKIYNNFNYKEWFNKTPFYTVTICGPRRSGKTRYLKYLLREYLIDLHGIKNIYIFYGSDFNQNYDCYIPKEHIYKFDENILMQKYNDHLTLFKKKKHNNTLFIFDDCATRSYIRDLANILDYIYKNGRHVEISIIFLSQYSVITPTVSANTELFILRRTIHKNLLENIRLSYVGYIPQTKFIKIMKLLFQKSPYATVIFDTNEFKIYLHIIDIKITNENRKLSLAKKKVKKNNDSKKTSLY